MVKVIVIAFLILIGIGLRIYNITNLPGGLFSDEIALAINAKTIAEDGVDEFGNKLPFGFVSFEDYKMPGYIYLTAAVYKFLGPQMLTIRFMAIMASLISIPLIGYFTYLLFPKAKNLPYYAMIALALSPYHIHFSRIAYETMLATAFLLVYFIAFIKTISSRNKIIWFFVGSIGILLSSWTYPAPRFIIPVFTVSILIWSLFIKNESINRKRMILTPVLFMVIVGLSYIPSIMNPIIDQRPLGYILQNDSENFLAGLSSRALSTFTSWFRIWNFEFLFLKGDIFGFRHSTKEIGLLFPIFLPPLIVGIYSIIRSFSFRNFHMIFFLLFLIIAGLPSSLTSETPYGPRLFPMILPISIIVALGIDRFVEFAYRQKKSIKNLIYFVFFFVFASQVFWYTHIYFTHFAHTSLPEFPKASIDLVMYIQQEIKANPQRKIYFLNGNSCMPWAHDELKLWYFADLNNKDMIQWNIDFQSQRKKESGGFDNVTIRPYTYNNILLNPTHEQASQAPSKTLIARCGIHFRDIDTNKEKIKKIFYMYEQKKKDIIYFVTEKV